MSRLDAFVEKRHKIGVNDIWIVLKELQQEQLIPSNQPTFPELKADAFFDLEDDYTTEVEQSSESRPTAKETRRPAAPASDMETARAPTKRYTRYWFIALSLVGLSAIGVESYLKKRASFDSLADELKDSQYTVARIVGIIDNRGRGTSDYISNLRAKEVARYLSNCSIAADRLRIEDDNSPPENNPESSEYKTSPRPERVVEVTVLIPTGRENQRE